VKMDKSKISQGENGQCALIAPGIR
jgi:hypothetical protein